MTLCCIIARRNLCVICSTVNIDPIFDLYDKLYQSFVNLELCLINLKFVLLLFNCVHPLLLGKCSRYTLDLKKNQVELIGGFHQNKPYSCVRSNKTISPITRKTGEKGWNMFMVIFLKITMWTRKRDCVWSKI